MMPFPPQQCKYCFNQATIGEICDSDECRMHDELSAGFVARAELATMGDASFQEWLDEKLPDLSPEVREAVVDQYRAGVLFD